MASKRHLRRRSCESKVRHNDQISAIHHSKSLGAGYATYKCQFCNGWHVGRPSNKKIKAMQSRRRNLR